MYEDVSILSAIVDTSHELGYRHVTCLLILNVNNVYTIRKKHSVLLMPVTLNFKGMLLSQYILRTDRCNNNRHVEITKKW